MRISMIGTGYVGLVSGACFAERGVEVVCVDKDAHKIAQLAQGIIPIYEPGLDALVVRNSANGRMRFTTDLASAVAASDAVFIAVGTPPRRDNGQADLSFVRAVAAQIAESLDGYTMVITKSTVPVGTGAEIEAIIRKRRPDIDVDVISNPEFLREGTAIEDFMKPDRVVIGTDSQRARELMHELYRPWVETQTKLVFTSRVTAELIKYAGNTFLATKISFINEMADLCEKVGANVQEVARGMGLDERIGHKFLHAGPGYGGSCFSKDASALVHTARSVGMSLRIVEAGIEVNQTRKRSMAQRVIEACGGRAQGKTIAVLGLTFKPNTDDMRDAPSLDIVPALQQAGATVRAFDPVGMEEAKKHLQKLVWCHSAYEAMQGADALVIITEWSEFCALDWNRVKQLLRAPVIIDLRNIYTPHEMANLGFRYFSIGRPSVSSQPAPIGA